ncbi:RHS repeat-associated core domain-containing protein [Pseudomonas sp. R1-6]|uniref:RHS repeat-associated core domain-containing protein n=1 Tax=Pseudomonas sp. R1-6 TaxID=2817397 RepID=UPI003DA839E4
MDALKKLGKQLGVSLLACVLNTVAVADTVTYFHNDISGSPLAATDATGELLWKENYKPYGDKLNRSATSNSNKIGYHGKVHDDSTGLSYMGARYYDPVVGRFMGVDPVDFQTDNLHSFNRYAYTNNNPYKYVDPNGRYAYLVAPIMSLFSALSVSAILNSANNSGKEFTDGGAFKSTPASHDLGNSDNWSAGKVYNEDVSSTKTDETNNKSEQRPTKTPNEGEPGSRHTNPGSGQERWYGPDGKPIKDIDWDHNHGQGVPHVHDWGRGVNGNPTRAPGRPFDPKIDRWTGDN